MLKLSKKKLWKLAIFLPIFLLAFSIFYFWRVRQINQTEKLTSNRSGFKELINEPKPTVTPSPPTPTPTLTAQQIAEIKKQTFEAYNQKYGPCRYLPILMYHHIMPKPEAKAIGATNLNVPPEIFREQLDYLLSKGYNFLRLDEMMSGLKNNSLPGKPMVLTFDDNYRDFYTNLYPILKEKNVKATVFVISQYVGGERYTDWWQLSEMAGSGLVLIGDHTLNHPSLPRQTKEEEYNQIVSAKKIIEEQIGVAVNYFAYPYGSVNVTSEQILKENGFLGAVTTIHTTPVCVGLPYELPRYRIGSSSMKAYGF